MWPNFTNGTVVFYCPAYRKSLADATDTYLVLEVVIILKGGKNNDNETTRLVVNSPSYSFRASAENGMANVNYKKTLNQKIQK